MASFRKGPPPIEKTTADGAVVTGQIRIRGFRFICAAGGTCLVKDDLGNPIFNGATSTTQPVDEYVVPYEMNIPGYQLTQITATGILDIYAD